VSGDWAWGPPAGEREPDEDADACAARELLEETGLAVPVVRTDAGNPVWLVYLAEGAADAVCLSAEHERCVWLPLGEAAARTAPEAVRAGLLRAAAVLGDPAAGPAAAPARVLGVEDDVPFAPLPNELTVVLSNRLPSADRVTAVFGLVFEGDRMLMARLRVGDRGWDIPGGHVEPGETPAEAVRREVHEETGVRLGPARVFASLAVRVLGPPPSGYRHPCPDSYMVYYRAPVAVVEPFEPTEESAERGFLSPEAIRETRWYTHSRGLYEAALADALGGPA
jgi:8-oxo-dGTP pyrophosphatase MutT (NUDIX family)